MAGRDWSELTARVRSELVVQADPDRAKNEKAYLKSDLEFIGVGVPAVRKVALSLCNELKGLNGDDLWSLFEAFWSHPVWELRAVGVELLQKHVALLSPDDLPRFRGLVVECSNWAFNDVFGCHLVGGIVVRRPEALAVMDAWAVDDDVWVRRVAMQSLLLPMRGGSLAEWPRFVRYAEPLCEAKDCWTRKVIGWVCREVSKRNPGPVHEFLKRNLARMSGLTLREGAKYLPAPVRSDLGLGEGQPPSMP